MGAKYTAKVNFDTSQADAALGSTADKMHDLNSATQGASGSTSTFADSVTATVSVVQAAVQAVTALVSKVSELADEMEKEIGIVNRFGGNIDVARENLNGLVSDIDLMTESNRAAAAGLQLTGDQFAALSVIAQEKASAGIGDFSGNMRELTQGLVTGSTQLLKYGVDVSGVTGITNKQTEALRQLTEQADGMTSSADTLGGQVQTLGVRWDNQKLKLFETANSADSLVRSFAELGSSITKLLNIQDANGLSPLEATLISIEAGMTSIANSTTLIINGFRQLKAAAQGDLDEVARIGRDSQSLIVNPFTIIDNLLDERAQGLQQLADQQTAAGVRARNNADTLAAARKAAADAATRRSAAARARAARARSDQEELNQLLRIENRIQAEDAANRDKLAQARADELLAQQASVIAEQDKIRVGRNALILAQQNDILAKQREGREHQAQLRSIANQKRLNDLKAAEDRQQARIKDGVNQSLGLARSLINVKKKDDETSSQARKRTIKDWLKNFALQQTLKGGEDIAEGIASIISNPPNAAAKFLGAGEHFALAAAAGGGAAAISTGGKGGGGRGASKPTQTGSGGTSGSSGGGGTTIINYNSPVAEADIGRMQARARRAAENRF